MHVSQSFHLKEKVAVLAFQGDLCAQDLCDAAQNMVHSSDFRPGMNALWDLTESHLEHPCREFIDTLLNYAHIIQKERGKNYKVAIVTDDNVTYGYARMLCEYGHTIPCSMHVFRHQNDALRWLSGITMV